MNNLIFKDLYMYDIRRCFYRFNSNGSLYFKDINIFDKFNRNKKMGELQRNNKSSYNLIELTNDVINNYIEINYLEKEDLLFINRDGFVSKKYIHHIIYSLPIDLKYSISNIIMSEYDNSKLVIKRSGEIYSIGVRDKPSDTSFYNLFKNIDLLDYGSIINKTDSIRSKFFKSDNILWFCNKIENSDKYTIKLKNGSSQVINISNIKLKEVDIKDIDKMYTWNKFMWPFCQSIINGV